MIGENIVSILLNLYSQNQQIKLNVCMPCVDDQI